MSRSASIWRSGLVSAALFACATAGGGGGEPNICDAWKVWGPQDKEAFLTPIWKKTLAAVQVPLADTAATPEQIAKFNQCFHDKRPTVSGEIDRACSAPGAQMHSEELATMASAYVPACMTESGLLGG
jgi:hypothetical protein